MYVCMHVCNTAQLLIACVYVMHALYVCMYVCMYVCAVTIFWKKKLKYLVVGRECMYGGGNVGP